MLKADKENVFAICAIVLCFALTLGLAAILSGEGVLSALNFGATSQNSYAIAVGGYTDMALARATSRLIQSRGGAGYIASSDDAIEIIYAVYPTRELCEQALANLGDSSAYIKEIAITKSKLKWAGDLKDHVSDALKYYDLAYDSLYEISNSLNVGGSRVEDAKVKIEVLSMQINDIKSDFYSKVQGSSLPQITEIKIALITALALIDNVEYADAAKTSSSIRYQLVQLVMCYSALMSAI